MAFYESVVITRPELTESQVENLTNDLIAKTNKNNAPISAGNPIFEYFSIYI